MTRSKLIGWLVLVFALLGLALPATAAETPQVEGFRSARLGMTFAEAKDAVRRDFEGLLAPMGETRQPDGNKAYVVAFSRLAPVAAPAVVSYLFGPSDTLREVRIAWLLEGEPADEERDAILRSGLRLAAFLKEKYAELNLGRTGGTGSNEMLLFSATDQSAREIALTISGIAYEPIILRTRQPARPATGEVTLILSYAVR